MNEQNQEETMHPQIQAFQEAAAAMKNERYRSYDENSTISEERLQKALNENAPSYLHADTEIRRICHIIATTEDDIETNPHGDAVLLESDYPDERPYYASQRMLLLERCELDIRYRDLYILDLELEALGFTFDEE